MIDTLRVNALIYRERFGLPDDRFNASFCAVPAYYDGVVFHVHVDNAFIA
jgi:hypothetical protein